MYYLLYIGNILASCAPFDAVAYERVCNVGRSFHEQLLHQVPFFVQQQVDQRQLVDIRIKCLSILRQGNDDLYYNIIEHRQHIHTCIHTHSHMVSPSRTWAAFMPSPSFSDSVDRDTVDAV